ncbi:MAG: hypothetical protein GYB31_04865 [Bacteroidetes bacterium]|nr:hypothetical protein [Bacteroidota bacterium]
MNNSKILKIARSLDKKERLAFRKYLDSPYFNKREDVKKLWDYLQKHLKKQSPALQKKAAFKYIYSAKAYKDRDFHLLKSYLLKHLEKFLIIERLEQDPGSQGQYLLDQFQRKNLLDLQSGLLKKLDKEREKRRRRDTNYLEQKRDLLWEKYQLQVSERPSGKLSLNELMELTDLAYYSRKLRQLCLLAAHRAVYRVEEAEINRLETDFLSKIEAKGLLNIPAIGIYYHGFQLSGDQQGQEHFDLFKHQLIAQAPVFARNEIRELFLIAINFCVRQVNDGNRQFFAELLELYQAGLDQKILLQNGQLSRFSYHNIVATGLQARQFEWVEDFIEKWIEYVEPAYREASYQYNLARLEFETSQYDSAQERLIQANFSDLLLNLAAKTISLKIYFHQDETDLLMAHLNAMNKFIRRNKVIGYHRTNYLNILKYSKKLIYLNIYDKEAKEQLAAQIKKEEILTEKEWLLDQIL